jgi:hypothetical protein
LKQGRFLTIVSRQPSKSISHVPLLVCGAAVLAFLDMEILTRHLLEIQVMPLGFTQAVVRPILAIGAILCLVALYIDGAMPRGPVDPARRIAGFKVLTLCLLGWVLAVMMTGAFEFQSRTEHWEDGSGSTTTTYPAAFDRDDRTALHHALRLAGPLAVLEDTLAASAGIRLANAAPVAHLVDRGTSERLLDGRSLGSDRLEHEAPV